MNKEEIEKILDRLERIDHKEYSCSFEFADSGSFEETCMCFDERKKLANYIKTLQEENKQLKEAFEENNKNYFRTLQMLEETNQVLVLKIDKAIGYINELIFVLDKENKYLEDKYHGEVYMYKANYVQDLLKILKGDSNE